MAMFVAMWFIPALTPCAAEDPAKPTAAEDAIYQRDIVPFLKKHCLDCHSGDEPEGEVALEDFKVAASIAADQKTWQRVIEMLRTGAMPPEDADQPLMPDRRRIITWPTFPIWVEPGTDPGSQYLAV